MTIWCTSWVFGFAYFMPGIGPIHPIGDHTPLTSTTTTMPPMTGHIGHLWGPISLMSGISLPTRIMMVIWYRGMANASRLLGNGPPDARTAHELTFHVPYEIVEMIVAYLIHDLHTLKACSLTCRSWYIVAVPHLHHTLTLTDNKPWPTLGPLRPLSQLHKLGLALHVKEIRVAQWHYAKLWFGPEAFSYCSLRYFSAFANVHTLRIKFLEAHRFIPGIERYLGHFSSTLRSIRLEDPRCTPQHLSCFLSFFSNLDDIEILRSMHLWGPTLLKTELVPFSKPKLRGRLALYFFGRPDALTHFITSFDGLRFRYMNLRGSGNCAPILLEACAQTLETIRLSAETPCGEARLFNLSRLKVLQSLELESWTPGSNPADHRSTFAMEVFSTITSPVFTELVVVLRVGTPAVYLPQEGALLELFRTMHEIRPFNLVFLFDFSHRREEIRRNFVEGLDLVAAKGFLDFLASPPTIC